MPNKTIQKGTIKNPTLCHQGFNVVNKIRQLKTNPKNIEKIPEYHINILKGNLSECKIGIWKINEIK